MRARLALSLVLLHASRVRSNQAFLAECAAYGCGGSGSSDPDTTVVPGTTLIDQTGNQPPSGYPGATPVSTRYENGQAITQWQVTQPTTLAVPSCGPTSPPGATWSVTTKEVTHVVGGKTLIFREPELTAVPPKPVVTTSTEYVHLPPVTLTETSTSITTSTLPPQTLTETSTTTSFIPTTYTDYVTLPAVTNTVTETTTSVSVPPPQTLTSTEYRTSYPPPVTSTQYIPTTLTESWTSTITSTSTWTSTTTSVSVSTSVSVQTLPPQTVTATSTVSYCPPGPTGGTGGSGTGGTDGAGTGGSGGGSTTSCTPAVVKDWTNVDVYISQPLNIDWNDANPGTLKIVDAGYRTETYTVLVDGTPIGRTSDIQSNSGSWCALQPSARGQCESLGMSKGEFVIPAGKHTVSIKHNNDPGTIGTYSTLFYSLERKCDSTSGSGSSTTSCTPAVTKDWTNVDVYISQPFNIDWNDANPGTLKIVDAGYRTETYTVLVDGTPIGRTSDIQSNSGSWCALQPSARAQCESLGMSKGEFPIPAGKHTVSIKHNNDPGTIGTYSTLFYSLERKCGSGSGGINQPTCSPAVTKDWSNVDIYPSQSFDIDFNDAFPNTLRVTDAGYRTETYTIFIDGVAIGTTSPIQSSSASWCPIQPSGRQQCENQGNSKGQFTIPAGKHKVSIKHNNDPGTWGYSTVFYQLERDCSGSGSGSSQPACTPAVTKDWSNVDIYPSQPFNIDYNDAFPHTLRVTDAGYRTETYTILVDGVAIGTTSPIQSSSASWCPIDPSGRQQCENQGNSKGQFTIPAGKHTVSIKHNNDPGTWGYSTVFYQLERDCRAAATGSSSQCSPATLNDWTKSDVFKNSQWTFNYDDQFAGWLSVQDAGYRSETFTILVDGNSIGRTSSVSLTDSVWCALEVSARLTCEAMGMSNGRFVIPAGKHTVAVQHNNEPGSVGESATFLYKIERKCSDTYPGLSTTGSCSATEVQGWTNIDIYEGGPRQVTNTNYNYPVKVTVVDAGYKAEMYEVYVDNIRVGDTNKYTPNTGLHCGLSPANAQGCINQGFSTGTFVVPAGSHSLQFNNPRSQRPSNWAAYSTVLYRIDKYCS